MRPRAAAGWLPAAGCAGGGGVGIGWVAVRTSGVAVREAPLHSLSLELLSLSESDSELLSDSLELPEAPLEWP